MANFYNPLFQFSGSTPAANYVAYATANLVFFQTDWLAQFTPSNAHVSLWSGQKIFSIITNLAAFAKDKVANATALQSEYKVIFKKLTLTDYSSPADAPSAGKTISKNSKPNTLKQFIQSKVSSIN